jgi:hypothetical protein
MEATMTRNSLLGLATVATLLAASATTADARGGGAGGGSFGHVGMGSSISVNRPNPGSFVRSSTHTSIQHRPIVVKSGHDEPYFKPVRKYYRWIEPVTTVVVEPTPIVVEPIGDAPAAATPAVEPDKSARVAKGAPVGTANTCLTKEYLDTGAVMFRDTCANEWAINSTEVERKVTRPTAACLTKDTNETGVVTFRDTCTREWAMNTPDQMAQSPQAR